MTDLSLHGLRPKSATAAAIREALTLLRDERAAVRKRLTDAAAGWADLLLTGTPAAIRSVETAIRDDELNASRLDALEAQLSRRLTDAITEEAAAAHGEKVRDACAKIEAFNVWFLTQYEALATAIAEGVELERLAWRAIDGLRDPVTRAYHAELPALARAYAGSDARGLGFLTRLPATKPGRAIVWP